MPTNKKNPKKHNIEASQVANNNANIDVKGTKEQKLRERTRYKMI